MSCFSASFPRKVIFLAVATALPSVSAQANQEVVNLETQQVVSTATKTQQAIESVAASVQVISQQDIEMSGAQTLKDIFSSTPGLTLQYGTFPAASSASKSSVSLRGVGATGTLWLLDGRRLSGEVKNPYDMDRIPASSIERIEIVKGPMSALYGADAVGGIINIITKRPVADELQGSVSLGYGVNQDGDGDQVNLSASARGGQDNLRFSLNLSQQATKPYNENETTQTRLPPMPMTPPPLRKVKSSYVVPVSYREDSDITTIGGRIEFDLTEQTILGLDMNWFDEEREGTYRGNFHPTGFSPAPGRRIPAFDVPVRSRDDNTRMDIALDMKHQLNDQWDLQGRLYQSKYKKRNTTTLTEYQYFAYPSEAASAASGMSANVTIRALEAAATWYSPDDMHTVITGFEFRDENREATVFAKGNGFSSRDVDSKAVFIQDEWQLSDQTRLTLGGRYDSYTHKAYRDINNVNRPKSSDSKSTFRIGVNHQLQEGMNLRANLAQGYRTPDIRELFIQKRTPAGYQLGAQTIDPVVGKNTAYDLQPETTNTFEVGINGQQNALSYDVAIFYNNIEDRIQQTEVGTASTRYYTFKNVSKATIKGIDLNVQYAFNDQFNIGMAWSELDTKNKDTGRKLEFTPERSIGLSAGWKASEQLRLGASLSYVGKQYYSVKQPNRPVQHKYTDACNLLDVNVNYSFEQNDGLELFGGIRNLTDEAVDKRLGSNPGRYFHAGVRYNF